MTTRDALGIVLIGALAACGSNGAPGIAASGKPASIAGTYQMDGTTTEKKSGAKRKISGTVVFSQEQDTFTASFHLRTTYPTPDGPMPAEVIGSSTGKIQGRRLEGSVQTQLVMAQVPGLDPTFAFGVPRMVGPRLVSAATGEVAKDGTLTLETENEPAPGEVYAATRTILRGKRLAEGESPEGN